MRKTVLVVLFLVIMNSLHSQDLIVTNDGDTLNCKITKVKTDNIYFTFKYKGEIRNTLLPFANINKYQYNFFSICEVPEDKVIAYKNYHQLRLGFNGGYSYQTAMVLESLPSYLKNYLEDLKVGFHFGGELIYYYKEQFGFGLKYSQFRTSNHQDDIYYLDNGGNKIYGEMSDKITISFIGPTLSTRISTHDKSNVFLVNFSIGYMEYFNDKVFFEKYKMSGETIGLACDIGYDNELYENLFLGFNISFISGALTEYKWEDWSGVETVKLNEGEYESLNRIDFSVGLRLNM